jgi:hypothetical protein
MICIEEVFEEILSQPSDGSHLAKMFASSK